MVDNVNGVNGMAGMQPTRRIKTAYRMTETPAPSDTVEFTSDVMRLKGVDGVMRLERVMAIKSQIDAGSYFTPDKLDKAMDRALDDVLGQVFRTR